MLILPDRVRTREGNAACLLLSIPRIMYSEPLYWPLFAGRISAGRRAVLLRSCIHVASPATALEGMPSIASLPAGSVPDQGRTFPSHSTRGLIVSGARSILAGSRSKMGKASELAIVRPAYARCSFSRASRCTPVAVLRVDTRARSKPSRSIRRPSCRSASERPPG